MCLESKSDVERTVAFARDLLCFNALGFLLCVCVFGEGFKGERPPMPPPTGDEERAEKEAERIKKRTEKMRKILTDEQYDIWLTLKPEPPVRGKKPSGFYPGEDERPSFHPDSSETCCE